MCSWNYSLEHFILVFHAVIDFCRYYVQLDVVKNSFWYQSFGPLSTLLFFVLFFSLQYVRKFELIGACNFRCFSSHDKQRNLDHFNLVKKNLYRNVGSKFSLGISLVRRAIQGSIMVRVLLMLTYLLQNIFRLLLLKKNFLSKKGVLNLSPCLLWGQSLGQ